MLQCIYFLLSTLIISRRIKFLMEEFCFSLPDPYTEIQDHKTWEKVQVKLNGWEEYQYFRMDSLGPIIFLSQSSVSQPKYIIFTPNFFPMNEDGELRLQSSIIDDYAHRLIFIDFNTQNMFHKCYLENLKRFSDFISTLSFSKTQCGDELMIFYSDKRKALLSMCSLQSSGKKQSIQSTIIDPEHIGIGFQLQIGEKLHVSPAINIPRAFGSQKDIVLAFYIFDESNENSKFYIKCQDIAQTLRWILSIHVWCVLNLHNQNKNHKPPEASEANSMLRKKSSNLEISITDINTPPNSPPSSPSKLQSLSFRIKRQTVHQPASPLPSSIIKDSPPRMQRNIKKRDLDSELKTLLDTVDRYKPTSEYKNPTIQPFLNAINFHSSDFDEKSVQIRLNHAFEMLEHDNFDHFNKFSTYEPKTSDEILDNIKNHIKHKKNLSLDFSTLISLDGLDAYGFDPTRFVNVESKSVPYTAGICMIIQDISKAPKVINDNNITSSFVFYNSALWLNGFRYLNKLNANIMFIEALQELADEFKDLNGFIDRINQEQDIKSQAVILSTILLNTGLLIPLYKQLQRTNEWILKYYHSTSLMADEDTIDIVQVLITPVIIKHSFDLAIQNNLLSYSSTKVYNRFVRTPAFVYMNLDVVNHGAPKISMICKRVIEQFTYEMKKKSKVPTHDDVWSFILESSSIVPDKINEIWNQYTQSIKDAKSHTLKESKLEYWITQGLKTYKLHFWIAYLVANRAVVKKWYYKDGTFVDPYRSIHFINQLGIVIDKLHHYLKNLP